MTLLDEVHAVYDSGAAAGSIPSYPFIGSAFTGVRGALRIACLGINSYISPKDWRPPEPGWFASWFREQKFPFSKGAAKAASTIGRSLDLVMLVPRPRAFAARRRAEDLVAHADFQRVVGLGRGE